MVYQPKHPEARKITNEAVDGGIIGKAACGGHTSVASNVALNGQNGKNRHRNGNGIKFAYCPYCSKKGLYKVPRRYEHCRCCGLHRILLPGQDF